MMESKLKKFTESLIPSDEFIKHGLGLVNKVEELLKKEPKYSIARIAHAGSLGKGTEIMAPDFDVVVFLNNEYPPFKAELLKEWATLLANNDKQLVLMKTEDTSLKFKFTGSGVKVDLLPATNFVSGVQQGVGGREKALLQRDGALKHIANQATAVQNWYAGSLSESQVEFMKEQSAFTHELVRLGKYWYKTLYLGPKNIYGMKLMLEVIAVSVAQKMKGEGEAQSLTTAFREFLILVSQIDGLQVTFDNWKPQMKQDKALPNAIYDPNNKFNNLALNFKGGEEELKNLKNFAVATKDKLTGNNTELFNLFQPSLPKLPATWVFPSYLLSYIGSQPCKFNQDMVVRNEEKRKKNQELMQMAEIFLVAAVNSAAASIVAKQQNVTMQSVEGIVRTAMTAQLVQKKYGQWADQNAKQEACDVTFIIPATKYEHLGAIQVGLKWQ